MSRTFRLPRAFTARTVRPLAAVLLAALAAGCAAPGGLAGSGPAGGRAAAAAGTGAAAAASPAAAPLRTTADAAALRRCMDNLLVDYGVRDLTVLVEQIDDRAQRGDGGARELLLAAASDITQRSRAIRLLASAPREPGAARPQYTLRGTLRRLDSRGGEAYGLDLALQAADDGSIVPGSATRTAVLLDGGQAELRRFGTQLTLPAAGPQGTAVALRALADVAAIELFGRLAKVPYWSCFGAGLAEPTVATEVQDWYDTLAARPAEIIGWFQQQLRTRRLYDGPIDGAVNVPLKDAVARYREALGLSREPKLSIDFFQAYLAADHHALAARLAPAAQPSPVRPPAPTSAPPSAPPPATAHAVAPRATPLDLRIAAANDAQRFARGEAVQLAIRPSRDAHVYCFLQDENRRITRFFPNRFQRDSRVPARAGLQLPGAMRFEITMNPRGVTETVTCFGTERDVLAALPAELSGADFSALPLASLDQLRHAFLGVTDGTLAQESFQIRARP